MIVTSRAFAKLNLSLDIVSRMDNGYHNLKMVMQTINLCDEITIECLSGGSGFSVVAGLPFLPHDERNITVKAAKIFFEHTGISGFHTKIHVVKNIPVCAGMGGGSADAASVLRMLNELFETDLDSDTLRSLGLLVGSDVPFCINGGTALAEGRGEILTDLPPLPLAHFVVCKPHFSCSTPQLFSLVHCEKIRARPDTSGLIVALKSGDLGGVARRMYNVFEDILPRGKSDVDEIKGVLLDLGALGAVMTGSGPTVFGVFDKENSAHNAYEHLKPEYKDTFLAHNT
ncbi:MAG: 4-(cytidine 5'-diphospho)-2-C-methyl-D-erythritol kinase [Oscillospiraceae bacterium]|nr:4-(cytidine 5'-diphospho)-2-C-methyl-D-erythritol kinase [Oscillospiraceae bacterium]MCL2279829.1 4-(cytidine 5'-diphospho)-2-C-methyl-D-erythritol kinase [Oscillospiraceae bacterium]